MSRKMINHNGGPAPVERLSQRVPRVVAKRRITMPVRPSPFEQLSDHRSAVPLPLMPAVDDQSADPKALVGRIDAPHCEADDLISGPNGERAPWVSRGAQSQVVGHGRYETRPHKSAMR